jgi:hypothetical protein
MGYDNGKLYLVQQAIAGPKQWLYHDTGGESVVTYEGAGYFANAKDMGVDTGDYIHIRDDANDYVYSGRFTTVQDTGDTQGTVTLDTGPDIPG